MSAWYFDYIGSAGQINAAAAALTVVDTGNGESAQLARAVSDIVNETNSLSAFPMLHCVASGQKTAQTSRIEIEVNLVRVSPTVPRLVGGVSEPSVPTNQIPSTQ